MFLVEAKQAGIFEIRNLPRRPDEPDHGHRLPADRLSRTCAATSPTSSRAPASRRCTWPRSTSRPCTSSSRPAAAGGRAVAASSPRPEAAAAAPGACYEDLRVRRRRLGHGPGRRAPPPRHEVTLWARDAAQAQATAQRAREPALPAGRCLARDLAVRAEPAEALPRMAGASDLAIIATPMAGLREHAAAAARSTVGPWPGCARASKRRRPAATACWATRSRPQVAPGAAGRRPERPELRAGSGARPADGAGGRQRRMRRCAMRWSRPSTAQRCASMPMTTLPGVEVGGAVKNVLAIATGLCDGLRPGLECAGRADHPRPGRNDAAGRRAGRARRNLHGAVRAGRPGAHGHRRPEPQPPGRPVAGAGQVRCEQAVRFARACGRRRLLRARPWCAAHSASAWTCRSRGPSSRCSTASSSRRRRWRH